MSIPEPPIVKPIADPHRYKRTIRAVHIFNTLVLDEKLRYYGKKMEPAKNVESVDELREWYTEYFSRLGATQPMDFTTIRDKIIGFNPFGKQYHKDQEVFEDMHTAFTNAILWREEPNPWRENAERLQKILRRLQKGKRVKREEAEFIAAKEYASRTAICPDCFALVLAQKPTQTKKCHGCKSNIVANQHDCFTCFHHHPHEHLYCRECMLLNHCRKCHSLHSPSKCPKKNVKKYKELQFRMAPNASAKPVTSKFARMDMNEMMCGAFTRMINALKEKDPLGKLFTGVDLPAYRVEIKTPIHFGDILRRLNGRTYKRVCDIQKDILLLFDNCYSYNGQPNPRIKDDFSTWVQTLQDELYQYMQTLHENLVAYGYIGSSSHSQHKKRSKKKHLNSNSNSNSVVDNDDSTDGTSSDEMHTTTATTTTGKKSIAAAKEKKSAGSVSSASSSSSEDDIPIIKAAQQIKTAKANSKKAKSWKHDTNDSDDDDVLLSSDRDAADANDDEAWNANECDELTIQRWSMSQLKRESRKVELDGVCRPLSEYKMTELRGFLRQRSLKVGGVKKLLIERLQTALEEEQHDEFSDSDDDGYDDDRLLNHKKKKRTKKQRLLDSDDDDVLVSLDDAEYNHGGEVQKKKKYDKDCDDALHDDTLSDSDLDIEIVLDHSRSTKTIHKMASPPWSRSPSPPPSEFFRKTERNNASAALGHHDAEVQKKEKDGDGGKDVMHDTPINSFGTTTLAPLSSHSNSNVTGTSAAMPVTPRTHTSSVVPQKRSHGVEEEANATTSIMAAGTQVLVQQIESLKQQRSVEPDVSVRSKLTAKIYAIRRQIGEQHSSQLHRQGARHQPHHPNMSSSQSHQPPPVKKRKLNIDIDTDQACEALCELPY